MSQISLFSEKPSYSLADFEFLQDPKDKNSRLGVGSFATVKLARQRKNNKLIALKMVDLESSKSKTADLHNLRTEVHIHRRIDHPNIIKYHGYTQEEYSIYIVLDYAEKGNLYSYIHKRKILTPQEIFRFFHQTCLAVQYLHKQDVMHRDIKPENLLLDKDLNIKLCDFGWATERIKDKRTTFCGTYEYMAPEIVYKRPYDYHIDIWSLGILLYELIHKEAPYKGRSLSEIHNSLSRGTIRFCPTVDTQAKDLIQKILKINPSDRLSVNQILAHPWVKKHLPPEPKEDANPVHAHLKHERTHRVADKENHNDRLLTSERYERPITSAENTHKKPRKQSGWQPLNPYQSEIRRRPAEETHLETSGGTYTKSSCSLAKTVLETLESEERKMSHELTQKGRKLAEMKGLSPNLKRSLQSIVSPPNRVSPPDQVLSEALTNNTPNPSSISSLLENFSSYGCALVKTTSQTPGLHSSNSMSASLLERPVTANTMVNSNTTSSLNTPVNPENHRVFIPAKKLRTLTTSHTPTNSRLFCAPVTPVTPQITSTATTRAPSHQKTLTVINESDLSRKMLGENQGNISSSNRVIYKGNRFLISPRVFDTSGSINEGGTDFPRTVGSLVSPVGWTRRKLIATKSTTEASKLDEGSKEEESGLKIAKNFENMANYNTQGADNGGKGNNNEDKESFGINFNQFIKGEYRPKTVAKGAESVNRIRPLGAATRKIKGHNKENKSEGEKKIKRLMSLEKLYTSRDAARFQCVNL